MGESADLLRLRGRVERVGGADHFRVPVVRDCRAVACPGVVQRLEPSAGGELVERCDERDSRPLVRGKRPPARAFPGLIGAAGSGGEPNVRLIMRFGVSSIWIREAAMPAAGIWASSSLRSCRSPAEPPGDRDLRRRRNGASRHRLSSAYLGDIPGTKEPLERITALVGRDQLVAEAVDRHGRGAEGIAAPSPVAPDDADQHVSRPAGTWQSFRGMLRCAARGVRRVRRGAEVGTGSGGQTQPRARSHRTPATRYR